MLSDIREKSSGPIAWVILIVIGASFVFVGVGLNFNFLGNTHVAKVNDDEVGINFFEGRYRDFIAENPQFANVDDALRTQVRRQLLQNAIREVLIDRYLSEQGFAISDQQVAELIQQTPEFQTNGIFDREQYRTFLGLQGLDPTQYETVIRQRLREQQLTLALGATALVTPAEYRRYLNLVAEQRVVTTASLTPELVDTAIEVTDEEIVSFYDENATMYQLSESADIDYILISRDQIAESVEVTESELAEYYAQEKSRYMQDEQRQARHILILFGDDKAAAELEASAILARANAGEPFADLARQYSKDGGTASNGGDLGVQTREQMPDELGTAVFAMSEGEIRGLVETDFGYHIVQLDSILATGPLPLEQVRGDLLVELREDEADIAFRELERRVSDALFDTPELGAVAEAVGVSIQSFAGFTRNGGGELGANQAAIDAVFDPRVLEDGEVSDVVELDIDSSAVFKVTRYNEATRQPLSEVRDQVASALRMQKADALMAERAARIVAAANDSGDFAASAEAEGAVVNDAQALTRDNRAVDPSLVVAAFTAPKPTENAPVLDFVRNQEGGYTIFRIDAVLAGRPESIPVEARDQGKLQLAQQLGIYDFNAFVEELVATADIEIDEKLLAGDGLLQ